MRPPCTRCDDANEKCSGLPGEKCGRCKRNHGKCSHATRSRGGTSGPTTVTTSTSAEAAAGGEGTAAGADGTGVGEGEGEEEDEEDDDMVEMLVASGLSVRESQKGGKEGSEEEGEDNEMEEGAQGANVEGASGKADAAMDVDTSDAAPVARPDVQTLGAIAPQPQPQAPANPSAQVANASVHDGDIEMGDINFSLENLEKLGLDEETKKTAVALRGQMQGIDMAKTALDRELEKISERLREVLGRARVQGNRDGEGEVTV